jgi:CDP-diacylglycerol--glycerol-3-phosphate 3-phosphatidyltransferase
VIKASFGERLDAWIHRLFPFLFWRRLRPDALTVAGAAVSVAAAVELARGELLLGGVLILFSGFFDLVDGVVARHHGVSTSFGAFLDATLDRLVDTVLMIGLIVLYASSGDLATVVAASAALVGTILTSYAKARAETVIPKLEGGLLERGERIGLLAVGALLDVMVPVLWVLAAGAWITVAQRFAVAYRELGRLDAERSAAAQAGDPA